jgi:acetoacetyl-CoA synthetase
MRLYEILEYEKITHFGTSARYIDACFKADLKPKQKLDLSDLRAVLSTGSPLVPSGFNWVYVNIGDIHLASISGGTDICACFVGGWPNKPVYSGQIQGAMLGLDVDVVDENGNPIIGEAGELVCKNAHPSMPLSFYNDEDNKLYKAAYFSHFENIWAQGDWAIKHQNGGFEIIGRSDTTLNPGGVRIGTAEIYRQLANIEPVIESVAIGKKIEGDVELWLFVKLAKGVQLNEGLKKRIKVAIRQGASPRHVPKRIIAVRDIPVTLSGKISEIAVRDVIHGREVKNIGALANPQSLKYFKLAD